MNLALHRMHPFEEQSLAAVDGDGVAEADLMATDFGPFFGFVHLEGVAAHQTGLFKPDRNHRGVGGLPPWQ